MIARVSPTHRAAAKWPSISFWCEMVGVFAVCKFQLENKEV
jgi:hypothetical protein